MIIMLSIIQRCKFLSKNNLINIKTYFINLIKHANTLGLL